MIRKIYRCVIGFLKPSSQIFRIRQEFIDSIDINKKTLEIGPFCSPKSVGPNVKYFDILNTDELIQRATSLNYSKDQIQNVPFIHFVSKTGDLSIIDEKFDIVVSSHLIEHQLDLVGHLNQVSDLLNPGGKYFLIIPDKRYCFDHFQNVSTIADVILANLEKRKKHSIKSVIEHYVLTTHNVPYKHWKGNHGNISSDKNKIQSAIEHFNTQDYIDVHAWYFTPQSFTEIVNILTGLHLIHFNLLEVKPTSRYAGEFYAILNK